MSDWIFSTLQIWATLPDLVKFCRLRYFQEAKRGGGFAGSCDGRLRRRTIGFQIVTRIKMAAKNQENQCQHPEFYNLYENELGSDVILLVGEMECQERLPAHSWVLANGSDYFKALFLRHNTNNAKEYSFPHDNATGFNNFVRWLYQNKCDLQSLQSSLDTLQVALKFYCPDLAVACVNQITKQLTGKNVLRVIGSIHLYCAEYEPSQEDVSKSAPSAPSLEELDDLYPNLQKCDLDCVTGENVQNFQCPDPFICCQQLYNECLDIIDKNADEVLNSEYLVYASASYLQLILQRPTLKISSEMKVFKALLRWSTAECKKRHLPLTLENRREVLGSLLFQTRLLMLTPSEFEAAKQELLSLLTMEEYEFLESYLKKRSPPPETPPSLQKHIALLATPRSSNSASETSVETFDSKTKRKFSLKKKFNKKDFVLDLVSLLALIFD